MGDFFRFVLANRAPITPAPVGGLIQLFKCLWIVQTKKRTTFGSVFPIYNYLLGDILEGKLINEETPDHCREPVRCSGCESRLDRMGGMGVRLSIFQPSAWPIRFSLGRVERS